MQNFGVTCGECGSDDCYFATCETTGGVQGHEWAVAFVCNACGARHPIECPDCAAKAVFDRAEIS